MLEQGLWPAAFQSMPSDSSIEIMGLPYLSTVELRAYNVIVTLPLQKAVLLGKTIKTTKAKAETVQDFHGWKDLLPFTRINLPLSISTSSCCISAKKASDSPYSLSICRCVHPPSSFYFKHKICHKCFDVMHPFWPYGESWRSFKNDSCEIRVKYNFLSLHLFSTSCLHSAQVINGTDIPTQQSEQ